jgi:hypothetical protein
MALEGMTKQGVRNLNNLGPRKKKVEAVEPERSEADDQAQAIPAPAQPLPEAPAVAQQVAP